MVKRIDKSVVKELVEGINRGVAKGTVRLDIINHRGREKKMGYRVEEEVIKRARMTQEHGITI